MKKTSLILIFAMLFIYDAKAADRDCIQYTPAEANAATSGSDSTSFIAVYSDVKGRTGNTNKDCSATGSLYAAEDFTSPVAKFGNRLLMIDRNEINSKLNGILGDIPEEGQVTWYKTNSGGDTKVGEGYYVTQPNGEPLSSGSYYAVIKNGNDQYKTKLINVQ